VTWPEPSLSALHLIANTRSLNSSHLANTKYKSKIPLMYQVKKLKTFPDQLWCDTICCALTHGNGILIPPSHLHQHRPRNLHANNHIGMQRMTTFYSPPISNLDDLARHNPLHPTFDTKLRDHRTTQGHIWQIKITKVRLM
jgi:hypothetical protein